jgi:hypothetical protein
MYAAVEAAAVIGRLVLATALRVLSKSAGARKLTEFGGWVCLVQVAVGQLFSELWLRCRYQQNKPNQYSICYVYK